MPKRINRWLYDRSLQVALATTQSELNTTKQNLSTTQSNLATTQSELNTAKAATIQVGTIVLLTTNTIPSGFLLCNGANISRTTYSALFAKIGTTYGAGNGSTTFTLPNMNNRYPIGPGTNALGKQITEQLPNISGELTTAHLGVNDGNHTAKGAFIKTGNWGNGNGSAGTDIYTNIKLVLNSSNSNSVYTNSGRVYPLSLVLNYVIKY